MRVHARLASRIVFCAYALAGTALFAADEIHWTITGQTSVTIDWRGAESSVRYGPTTSYGSTVSAQSPVPLPYSSTGPYREARITGLFENAIYHYSIGSGPDHTFQTPPPLGTSNFTVYAAGDIGDARTYPNVGVTQTLIAEDLPAFALLLGDLTYGNAHGQGAVDNHFNDVMLWSQDAAYMPIWGNHEWDKSGHCSVTTATVCNKTSDCPSGETCTGAGDDLRNYKGRFNLPNPQTSPGSPAISCCGEDWYWFDYGNVRFIGIPEAWTGAYADWSTKVKPVMDAAQADPRITFIVTFGHRPCYSSGHHPGITSLKGYLDTLGAAHSKYVLDLAGHSHNYERTYPQRGVIHITAGTGGSTLEEDGSCLYLTCTRPAWSAYRAMHLGPLKLRFTPTSIEGTFVCGPAGGGINDVTCTLGSVIDSFTIRQPATSDTQPPTAAILTPANGAMVSGILTIKASGSDNVAVAGLQFLLDGAGLGPEDTLAPYSIAWDTRGIANGAHSLSVRARDTSGNTSLSAAIAVTVSNNLDLTPPSVAVQTPLSGQVLSGMQTVLAAAADNVGVAGVQFKLDGANLGAEDHTGPYTISWDTRLSAPGLHTLTAVARDAAGNTTTSAPVTVTVWIDMRAPSVKINSPAPGATVSGVVAISAGASDDIGVIGVQFRIDGSNLGSEVRAQPWMLFWDTSHASRGSHTLTAVARDAAGKSTISAPVTVNLP